MNKEFKKVDAKIIGADSNVFNLLGICQRALKSNGYEVEARELYERVITCKNFDMALSIMQEYVNPIAINEVSNEI